MNKLNDIFPEDMLNKKYVQLLNLVQKDTNNRGVSKILPENNS